MNTVLNYISLFFIYSFLGWLIETLAVLIDQKELTNRGFFIGPIIPIYGAASIIMILYISQYKSNPLTVFFLTFIICSIIEYFTSYIMEKIFKARWWDYSQFKYNLNGRICLINSSLFGFLGLILIYFINPLITKLLILIPHNIVVIITLILLLLFIIDLILSFNLTNKLKSTINNTTNKKDNTKEIKEKTLKFLKNKPFQLRILKSFPNIKFFNLKNKK